MKHALYDPAHSSRTGDEWRTCLTEGYTPAEQEKIADALTLALAARVEGEMIRPRSMDVADILRKLKVDALTLQVALLSDPYLRDHGPTDSLRHRFGDHVAELVDKVNWLNTFDEYRPEEIREPDQAELLRQMVLAVVNDLRAVLVKLAYRLQRLRLLKHGDEGLRSRIAQETLDIFCPLANRLGIGQIKWELEDLSFRYLYPEEYRKLARGLAVNRAGREQFVKHFTEELAQELTAHAIEARVYGRPKHLYSIYRKMHRKAVPLESLYDLHAVRVLVDDVTTCYTVLGLVHGHWLSVPAEYDDYIAHPKENGYQSLHTVVIAAEGRPVEIQIRTEAMHAYAEYGVAAHWRYKEGGKRDALDHSINALRRLLEGHSGNDAMLEDFRADLFDDQIFVLTPKGQVIRLSKGATPVDFAYSIHSEVGHRCRGARVNGRMVPLTYTLKSGEKVEILTTRHGGPSHGWLDPHLGYVKTSHARNKIRQWFKQQDHEKHLKAGKTILEQERHKLGLRDVDPEELARHFHLPRADDLLLALGRADISPVQLAQALKPPEWLRKETGTTRKPAPADSSPIGDIRVQGVRHLLTHLAHCCEPTPGDPIIGYVTLGRGVAIHREDCHNILQLPAEKRIRLIDVAWGQESESYPVEIEVRAIDRKGLLKDITQILAHEHVNILRTFSLTDQKDQTVLLEVTAEVSGLGQLSLALDKLAQVHNVLSAQRKGG
jgi:GTP pyrophosphokinase